MYCDGHIHILPGLDTGPLFVGESMEMLRVMQDQGIRRMVAASHYNMQRESVADYLARRKISYRTFMNAARDEGLSKPHCIPVAEVDFMPDISRVPNLERLVIPNTRYMLIDLPIGKISTWMMRELAHMIQKRKIYPIVCNTERHLIYDDESEQKRLFSLPYTAYQVCWNAMVDREFASRIIRLYQEGKNIIFGTNAHNASSRPPKMRHIEQCIVKNYGETLYKKFQLNTNAFYDPAFS